MCEDRIPAYRPSKQRFLAVHEEMCAAVVQRSHIPVASACGCNATLWIENHPGFGGREARRKEGL